MYQIEIKIRHRLNYQHTFRATQRHQTVVQYHYKGKSSLIIVQKAAVKPVPAIG